MSESVRVINRYGQIVHIPAQLAKLPNYMKRNQLKLDNVQPMEELKPIAEVKLEIEEKKDISENEVISNVGEIQEIQEISETTEPTKEDLFKLLDEKGIEYKKTFGIEKLKTLLNS